MYNEEIIYTGRNNDIELQLSVDSLVIKHNNITKAQVVFKNAYIATTTLDSTVNPEYFDLTKEDRIVFKFGQAGLAVGRYSAHLIVFDATNTAGLVWGSFPVKVE